MNMDKTIPKDPENNTDTTTEPDTDENTDTTTEPDTDENTNTTTEPDTDEDTNTTTEPEPDTGTTLAVSHKHPSIWDYIKIALILAAVTALEVFTYFRSVLDWGEWLVPSLMFFMVVKFYLVATWFMHLRFDNKLYTKMFVAGLSVAVGVYLITLTVFEFWV